MPYGNITRELNNEGNMSGTLTIQPTAGSGVSDVLVNGESVVTDHKAYVNIEVEQTVTEGKKIASVEVNGNSTDILIPEIKIYDDARGDLITTSDAMQAPAVELSVTLEPQQAGTGDPSPENVRPITGWTECKVQSRGKNLLEVKMTTQTKGGITATVNEDESITFTGTTTSQQNFILNGSSTFNLKAGSYILTTEIRNPSYSTILGYARFGGTNYPDTGSGATINVTDSDSINVYVSVYPNFSGPVTVKPMIRPVSDTDATYAPYDPQSTTYTINLGGTYYGGNLDAVDGKLLPYKYYASYNGETLIGPWISSMDAYTPHGTPTTGAQVVDFGAFETEVTLTPTQIDLLRGVNNLWSDGEVYVKWRVDIEMLLQSIIDNR